MTTKISLFADCLDRVVVLKKQKSYDLAWTEANDALVKLKQSRCGEWFMMYYQMADILAREKKWSNALEKMGLCIHYLGGLGGNTHANFVMRLLRKIGKPQKFDAYVEAMKRSKPDKISTTLQELLG